MLDLLAEMKRHSSKVVNTLKTKTSDMNPKKKLKAMVRTMLTSSKVGKLMSQRRAAGTADRGATRFSAPAFRGFAARRKRKPNWRRLNARSATPNARVKTVASQPPTMGGREPARAI